MGIKSLFNHKKEERYYTIDEALQLIFCYVSEEEYEKLNELLEKKSSNDFVRDAVKKWALEHEDPEVNKIGRQIR